MIIESLDKYLETVAGYIFDDDKVVTYKWLSKELEVHVDMAKQILWKFWQRYKEEKSFDCTFLLMGILHDDGMRVEVVKEKDLATAEEKYAKILSEHIYSLQKALAKVQLLEMTDDGDVRYSAIKCIESNERSNEEMHILRWGAKSNEVQPVSEEKINYVSEPVKMKEEISPEKKSMDKKKNAQKKGFDSLFGKVANKQKTISTLSNTKKVETDSTKQTLSKEDVPKPQKKNAQGGLSSFLQQNKIEEKVKNTASPESNTNTDCVLKDITEKETILENKKERNKNRHGKKRNRSKDISSATKRRKRITIQSDSSDTDDKEENVELISDEERKKESSPETIPPVKVSSDTPPQAKVENGKRKVLKTVDQTFEEDGFLVTKKVHVYESCSEDESEVVESKKTVVPEPHPEIKGKKNNKQTTLMNFFKKDEIDTHSLAKFIRYVITETERMLHPKYE
ncbi:uncharacterized protein LOC117603031 isoform X1 [Osmia lignaria lignaria]|uniref:uncharacterized protein LOC117603031 isoform X1 n=1 Tax=Osmia lignaria lignaria TaxID=1437193 RepID=UPI00402BA2F5